LEIKLLKANEIDPPLNITKITSTEQFPELVDFFNDCGGILGWDIETTLVKDFFYRRTRTVQFGNRDKQFVVDLLALCDGDEDLLFRAQGNYGANLYLAPKLKLFMDTIAPILCSSDFTKVGVVLSFEYMNFYWQFGLRTCGFFDCSLVEKVIYAGLHSLKHYDFYSMDEMTRRYFGFQIDKSLQTSFNLSDPLSEDQIKYAALDSRLPLSLRDAQMFVLKGRTELDLRRKGNPSAAILAKLNPLVLGDNLTEIAQIENDAIGAFQDMHIHGERINREKWLTRCDKLEADLHDLIFNELDPIFIPIVGDKHDLITDADIESKTQEWKALNEVTEEELALRKDARAARKQGLYDVAVAMEVRLAALEAARKEKKNTLKAQTQALSRRRTEQRDLLPDCEGNALINYASNKQLLEVVRGIPGLKAVNNMEDETLEKYGARAVMRAIQKYHSLSKEISTYGRAWATEWKTKACNEEGWLNPGDGRLHSVFNQLEAETGRSSSEKPNGQNVPQDKEVRSCFVADPPNENIRISDCCDSDTIKNSSVNGPDSDFYICNKCGCVCSTHPEEYAMITADMSGAELRIIAECADDPLWIQAFARGEDVHSVGTELLYEEKWPLLALPDCAYFKLHTPESVTKNPLCTIGDPQRQKCECPEHKSLRDDNKSTNFLLAYGGGAYTLAARIKKAVRECKILMALHEQKNPRIWEYLERSGKMAVKIKRAFDMFGRRRLFPTPTMELAKERFIEDHADRLELKPQEAEKRIAEFIETHKRKPIAEEKWFLTHSLPTQNQIKSAWAGMHESIERQGKNHRIQGTNATIVKLAMGSGCDKDGKPYLWLTLPQYRARLVKFVHDELVIQAPKQYAQTVVDLVGDAFKRAAATKMHKVVMEFDAHIAEYWKK
jgi:DNA polymerase I-like protein with 3'-5' exonuclease and polymerase domains